jgi:transposase
MEPKDTANVEAGSPVEAATPKSTEVKPLRSQRRRFCASEKLRILALADGCAHGELGALLRREGIYSASLSAWRAQRDQGSLGPKRRGPKIQKGAPSREEKKELVRQVQQLRERLAKAELIIEMQKKMAFLLSSPSSEIESCS